MILLIRQESGFPWDPLKFQTLRISDRILKNSRGHESSYRLVPLRYGNIRNAEPYTRFDMWVTRRDDGQMSPRRLPTYVSTPDPLWIPI
jgi:hypothetical protein